MIAPTVEQTTVVRPVREPAVRPGPPPALAATPDAMSLLKALRRCWRRAAGFGIAAAVLVAGLTWFALPSSKCTVQSLLKIDPSQKWVFDTGEPQVQFQTLQLNQLAILRSRSVLQSALDQPEVAALSVVRKQSNPVEWLEKEFQIEWPAGSEYLRIGLSGDDPAQLTILVKAITAAYLKEVTHFELSKRQARRDQLLEIYNGYQKGLEKQREEIRAIEKSNGPNDAQALFVKLRMTADAAATANQELLRVQSALRTAQIDLSVHHVREKTLPAARVPDSVLDEALKKDPLFESSNRKRLQVLDQISETRRIIRPERIGSQIRDYEQQLEQIDRALKEQRERIRPQLEVESRDKAREEYQGKLTVLEENIARLTQEEKELSAKVERLAGETKTVQEASVELDSKRKAIASVEAVAGEVEKQIEKLNVELQAPPRITVLEDAAVAHVSDTKKVVKMAGMAGAGTLGLVLFGFSWREFQARRVHGIDDVSHGLGLPVIGTLPNIGTQPAATMMSSGLYRSDAVAEAADAVRAMLLRSARSEGWRSVLVTSAVSGEGKTTLAAQLATSLGRAGLRTLLVDGDLRNPSAHAALGLEAGPGLAEVLRGEVQAADVIQTAAAEGLWLLAAGRADGRTIQMLSGEPLRVLLARLKAQFDFVVIDTCPVLPVADALSLGQHADVAIVSLLREVSEVRKVHQTCQRLALFGIRILGAVVHGIREEIYDTAGRYAKQARGV